MEFWGQLFCCCSQQLGVNGFQFKKIVCFYIYAGEEKTLPGLVYIFMFRRFKIFPVAQGCFSNFAIDLYEFSVSDVQ